MMVWQAHERNEWDVAIGQALGQPKGSAAASAPGLDPFSLADPPAVTQLLETAGLSGATFTEVREPVFYGSDVDSALEWVNGFTCTSDALSRLEHDARALALRRLRDLLAAHLDESGVWFDSAAWIVTAHRH